MQDDNFWKAYYESLTDQLRSEIERKRRMIGFSLEEWGVVVASILREREDEWRAFRQTMSKDEVDLLVDILTTERLKGRHEIFHARRTRSQGQLSPVVKVDLNTGAPKATIELQKMARAYDRKVKGVFRENIESICRELGCRFQDWAVTHSAILLENRPAIPLLKSRMEPDMFEILMAEMTTERIKGRREALIGLKTMTN